MSEEATTDYAALNQDRLGRHAFDLFERICKLYTMSGPIDDPSCQPYAECTFDYVRDNGSSVRLRMSLTTDPPSDDHRKARKG